MKIRVGIIGCGKIADDHVDAIHRVPDTEICAVCDNEELMARQLAERCGAGGYFADAKKMLTEAKPNVVHITTPPQGHYPLAKLCLEHGANVFLEKPFTVTAAETDDLFRIADSKGLKLTAGHNHQQSDIAVEMRRLINEGFLGGPPVHMESTFCYNLGSGQYAQALLGDKSHWVRALPGKLMQNVISHGVCKIAEYLKGDNPTVIASGRVSKILTGIGEYDIYDELRTIITDEEGTTAYFTFSSQIKPGRHEFRVFGPENFLIADHSHHTLIKGVNKAYKSYATYFFPPKLYGKQYKASGSRNIKNFLRNRFPMDLGRRRLLTEFYGAIMHDTPLPISRQEIVLTSRIMEAIFDQLNRQKPVSAAK